MNYTITRINDQIMFLGAKAKSSVTSNTDYNEKNHILKHTVLKM